MDRLCYNDGAINKILTWIHKFVVDTLRCWFGYDCKYVLEVSSWDFLNNLTGRGCFWMRRDSDRLYGYRV